MRSKEKQRPSNKVPATVMMPAPGSCITELRAVGGAAQPPGQSTTLLRKRTILLN